MNDPRAFWRWFQSAHQRLAALRGRRDEALLDELQDQLQRCSPDLWFEIGGPPDGPMELIISAEGDPDYFDDVRELIACAPPVPEWEFIAFKPAQGFGFRTEYDDVVVDPALSWFLPLESAAHPNAFGLRVAVPGFTDELAQNFRAAVYIVLETGLGELAAAEAVQYLEVAAPPDAPEAEGYIELNELVAYLAWRTRRDAAN